ncbi:peptidoglycan-binding protein [Streptomyces sp. NPDC050211]|uniref:peptidoglycan-binding protein n=1 Tax=Streptomyces sp. NPDC050211 TaxID=3154932 RepID=UPI00343802BC
MSRWNELPEGLDPRVRQLVVRLRRLKDHSGLSLRQLTAKTGYSSSSWERYLGGRSLPPQEAVEAMARIGGDDPTRLLALHEVAAEAWATRRATAGPETEVTAARVRSLARRLRVLRRPLPLRRRPVRIAVLAGTAAAVLAVFSALMIVTAGDGETRAASHGSSSASRSAPTYTCRVEQIDGHWYAGNSRTRDAVLTKGMAGPEVAEAQCLLRRAGAAPGDIDGIYGPLTERAVERVQQRAGLVVDGIMGPHTWEALRR